MIKLLYRKAPKLMNIIYEVRDVLVPIHVLFTLFTALLCIAAALDPDGPSVFHVFMFTCGHNLVIDIVIIGTTALMPYYEALDNHWTEERYNYYRRSKKEEEDSFDLKANL